MSLFCSPFLLVFFPWIIEVERNQFSLARVLLCQILHLSPLHCILHKHVCSRERSRQGKDICAKSIYPTFNTAAIDLDILHNVSLFFSRVKSIIFLHYNVLKFTRVCCENWALMTCSSTGNSNHKIDSEKTSFPIRKLSSDRKHIFVNFLSRFLPF